MIQKTRVAVLLGGDSPEREVSFRSGCAMAEALSSERYDVALFDVAQPSTPRFSQSSPHHKRVLWKELAAALSQESFDVVLPALHGGWGEDGTLQGILEAIGIPYVGSPLSASAIAIDKQVCKAYLSAMGVAVPRGFLVRSVEQFQQLEQQNRWIYETPIIVKPNRGGSSVAVAILKQPNPAKVREALEAALADDTDAAALIEEYIEGVEITCATVGEGENARALPLIEIVPQSTSAFYDYNAKYLPGGSEHLIPPRISRHTSTLAEEAALKAHRALGCRGVARSDFMIDNKGAPRFLEINTIPGMTATSLVPDAARAAGISFETLIETLVEETLAPSAQPSKSTLAHRSTL